MFSAHYGITLHDQAGRVELASVPQIVSDCFSIHWKVLLCIKVNGSCMRELPSGLQFGYYFLCVALFSFTMPNPFGLSVILKCSFNHQSIQCGIEF